MSYDTEIITKCNAKVFNCSEIHITNVTFSNDGFCIDVGATHFASAMLLFPR